MTLFQTQSPTAVLQLLGTDYTIQLANCTDCAGPAELIVTPDPCYGTQPNVRATWIGYYAVRCTKCGIHFPADMSASISVNCAPATFDEHRAVLQCAVDTWNTLLAA